MSIETEIFLNIDTVKILTPINTNFICEIILEKLDQKSTPKNQLIERFEYFRYVINKRCCNHRRRLFWNVIQNIGYLLRIK